MFLYLNDILFFREDTSFLDILESSSIFAVPKNSSNKKFDINNREAKWCYLMIGGDYFQVDPQSSSSTRHGTHSERNRIEKINFCYKLDAHYRS